MLESLLLLLPEILTGAGTFGLFQGALKFINKKKYKKYSIFASQVLDVVDNILQEHPEYDDSTIDKIINTTIDITSDGMLDMEDFNKAKRFIIDVYSPVEAKKPKTLNDPEKQLNKQKIEKKLGIKKNNNILNVVYSFLK